MADYTILASGTPVGQSRLESGDPPMGVASGRFMPLPAYEKIRKTCIASRDQSQQLLALSVLQPDGSPLPATLGVAILDYSAELGPSEIEVHALGIGYPLYEQLFPDQVAAYAKQFE